MFWEPHLSTLRVNANSVNAEDEAESRVHRVVKWPEMAKRCPEGKWVARGERAGFRAKREEREGSKKVGLPARHVVGKIWDSSPLK